MVGAFVAVCAVLAALALAGCGQDSKSGGPTKLSWFIFNEQSGAPQKIADRCSKQSGGRCTISFELLPNQADQQREQLVRRLGAQESSMDLLGLDVVWTGEFANADPAAVVSQGSGVQAAQDLGRDDRSGREARAARAHSPGVARHAQTPVGKATVLH